MVIVKNNPDGSSINFDNMLKYSYQAGKKENNYLRA